MTMLQAYEPADATQTASGLIARLERIPPTRIHTRARILVGSATFFDGFNSLAIAYVLPDLIHDWGLSQGAAGGLIAAGYAGQLLGALFFGWLAERIGRLRTLTFCVAVYGLLNFACLAAWSFPALLAFRFLQGIGIGGEVPVAGTYINEFAGTRHRGRFFLLYEVTFQIGLLACGMLGAWLVPAFGWRAMFAVAAIPVLLIAPLRMLLPESPRWLISRNQLPAAERVIAMLEAAAERHGPLPAPAPMTAVATSAVTGRWSELFSPFYRRRTLTVWTLWFVAYLINNGTLTWMPSLYRTLFQLPLRTSLIYGFVPNLAGVASAILVAAYIDTVGRRRWYMCAFGFAAALLFCLTWLGATSALEVMLFATASYATIQTITLSLYLYTGELYPTRIRALGCGTGSAWLRLGSAISPLIVVWILTGGGVDRVFLFFAAMALTGAVITQRFAIETKGRVLEELSP